MAPIPKSFLADTYIRTDWAVSRVKELAELLSEYKNEMNSRVSSDVDQEDKIAKILFTTPAPPLDEAQILVSDVLHNLRSALDYLVYALAAVDSKKLQPHTQFPIAMDEKSFNDQVKKRLKGVSPAHIEQIKAIQPFSGDTWLSELQTLSNTDKHRFLIGVTRGGEYTFTIKRTESGFEHEVQSRIELTFDDERPVVDTLQKLCSKVQAVVDSFAILE